MPKRPPGAGSVDQLPSGQWRVRFRNDRKKRITRTYPTETEARAMLAAALGIMRDTQSAPTGPLTLRGWGKDWFERRETDGLRSVEREGSVWKTHVLTHELADRPLRDLDRPYIVTWLDAVRKTFATVPVPGGTREKSRRVKTDRKVSRQTARTALRLVNTALGAACDAGHILTNPAQGVKMPRANARAEDAWTWLTGAEIDAIVRCETIPLPERAAYVVAIYAGLRRGELWALRWADVALAGDAPELTVRGSHHGTTKSGKVRRVPLLAPAREVLTAWRAELDAKNRARDADPVFPGESGSQRLATDDARWSIQHRKNSKGERVQVNGYRLKAGVARHVRFHDMRHTCASHLIQGTWGVKLTLEETREWLGHSTVSVTERYAHLCPDRLAARVKQAAEAPPRDPGPPVLVGHGYGGGGAEKPLKTGGAPGAIRTRDIRLRRSSNSGADSEVSPPRDPLVTRAVSVLEQAASGTLSRELVVNLARESIMAGVGGAEALVVLDGGEGIARAAVELAIGVLGAMAVQPLRMCR